MTYDAPAPLDTLDPRPADALDPRTVDEIERLRSAVMHAEAEQRFGVGRTRRTELLVAAEEAERAFLNAQGFASYNDYRLRIRRSTVIATANVGPISAMPDIPTSGPDGVAADTPAESGIPSARPRSDSHAAADLAVDTLPSGRIDAAPQDVEATEFSSLVDAYSTAIATATDERAAAIIDAAEAQATDILAEASARAADIAEHAERLRDVARAVAGHNDQHLTTLHALITDIERLRRATTADHDDPLTAPSSDQGGTH